MRILLLIIDAIVNLVLGFFLVFFPLNVVDLLGLPVEIPPFYGIILGAVLIGIGIALLMELSPGAEKEGWLGLGGAMIINLFAALALVSLLIGGRIYLPLRGYVIILTLLLFLLLLSVVEWWVRRSSRNQLSRKTDE
jgi:hypothetical protein